VKFLEFGIGSIAYTRVISLDHVLIVSKGHNGAADALEVNLINGNTIWFPYSDEDALRDEYRRIVIELVQKRN
jgi:hypothetical protein